MKTWLKVGAGIAATFVLGSWWIAANSPSTLSDQAATVIRDSDDHDLLENLLSRGANPNYILKDESTLKDSVINLIAGSQSGTEDGNPTLLCLACVAGRPEFVFSLLKHGADPNLRGSNPNLQYCYACTPLYLAIHDADPEIVGLLLKHGADTNLPAQGQLMPLNLAQEDLIGTEQGSPLRERRRFVVSLLKQAGAKAIPISRHVPVCPVIHRTKTP